MLPAQREVDRFAEKPEPGAHSRSQAQLSAGTGEIGRRSEQPTVDPSSELGTGRQIGQQGASC